MSYRNELERTNREYMSYLLAPKPLSGEDGEAAHRLWLELHGFHRRVEAILEPFDKKHWPALMAILGIMPGNFDFMIESWLGHLHGLGVLKDH